MPTEKEMLEMGERAKKGARCECCDCGGLENKEPDISRRQDSIVAAAAATSFCSDNGGEDE